MKRRSALGVVIAVIVLAAGAAASAGGHEPTRAGPVFLVSTGKGTSLRVWRTTEGGLCITPFRVRVGRWFCISRESLARPGQAFSCLCRQRHGTTLVAGVVKRSVRQGEKEDARGGGRSAPLSRAGRTPDEASLLPCRGSHGQAPEVARRVLRPTRCSRRSRGARALTRGDRPLRALDLDRVEERSCFAPTHGSHLLPQADVRL